MSRALKVGPQSRDRRTPQIKFPSANLVNQHGCARGGALMRAQDRMRILNESLARFGVAQKLGERSFE